MLAGKSLEVVFIGIIVSIVLRKALWASPGLLLLLLLLLALLLAVIKRFGLVIIAGGVSVFRHVAHVREEGLRGASVLVRQVSQAARQVRRRRHAVALPAGHLVRRPLHGRTEDVLVAGHRRLPAGCHRVGRGAHLWRGALRSSGNSGSMANE